MSPKISAIICTYNRGELLRSAIQSLIDQTLSVEDYEIVIVNNKSTDNTAKLIEAEFWNVANLVYIYEPAQGLSYARNTGLQNAKGEYVAYLDDDAVASPYWLENIVESFQESDSCVTCIGGKIEPIWSMKKPGWLASPIEYYLGLFDLGEKTKNISNTGIYIPGASMAFKRAALVQFQGFPVFLGRTSHGLMQGEDTYVQKRLESEGFKILYNPAIRIWHHVSRNRLKKRYFLNWAYSSGYSTAVIRHHLEPAGFKRKILILLRIFKSIFLPGKNIFLMLAPIYPQRMFADKCKVYFSLGQLIGFLNAMNILFVEKHKDKKAGK